jgi:hypothetical protein
MWRGRLDLAIDHHGRLVHGVQARSAPKQTHPAGVYEVAWPLYHQHDRAEDWGDRRSSWW